MAKAKLRTKSALSWFGGDSYVAPKIAAALEGCSHVTIPFVGGASILPHLSAQVIVCNDANKLAINFYKIASGFLDDQDLQSGLFELCQKTLSHPDEMGFARQVLDAKIVSPLLRAWAFWAVCWLGRKGTGGTDAVGNSVSVRMDAKGGSNAGRLKTVAKELRLFAEHFRNCEWLSLPYEQVLEKVKDVSGSGVYCDPPWVSTGQLYTHKFQIADHYELHKRVSKFKHAKVVMRYDDCELIRDLYRDWKISDDVSRDQHNQFKPEILITNR